MKKILVIGSLNMDIVLDTPHIPRPGETISGKSLSRVPGGKGANQAYAIGKLGGQVEMIGAIGKDTFGAVLKKNLEDVGVGTSAIKEIDDVPTGQAYIAVEETGENAIILIAGTNGLVTKGMIDAHIDQIKACDIVIMQLEIPFEVVKYVKEIASELGKVIIVDPAPAVDNIPGDFWQGIDFIKPNNTELEILVGEKLQSKASIVEGAKKMIQKGVKNVIVSMGPDGCIWVTSNQDKHFPANEAKVVDTTAAGDSFTAGFALALSDGKNCEQAIAFGQKVSAYVVSKKGAQTSIPTLDQL